MRVFVYITSVCNKINAKYDIQLLCVRLVKLLRLSYIERFELDKTICKFVSSSLMPSDVKNLLDVMPII